jgi:2-methylisocitrate lyase-like PEP mutase family enzyme
VVAAAARVKGVEVPVTVDAGMAPAELVAVLRSAGTAGCHLEDTDYAAGGLRDPTGTRSGSARFARSRRRTATGS